MDNKIKESLSETEKIIMIIYVIAIVLIKLIYDKLLITPIVLLGIIYVTAYRNSKNTDVNYLIKEKIELLIRHFLLLNILWNIIGLIIFQDSIFDDSITTIVINSFLFIICLLPFLGILKAISKIPEIEINKDMQIYRELPQNIEPAIIAYLLQGNISDKSDISATLLDLVRRGYLIIKDNTHENFKDIQSGILYKTLVINNKKRLQELKEYEQYLINWFLRVSNSNAEINLAQLKNNLKKSGSFKQDYDEWDKLVKKEADKVNLYDSNNKLAKFSKTSINIAKKMVVISICFFVCFFIGNYISEIIDNEFIIIFTVLAFFIHIIISILSIIVYDLRLPSKYLSYLEKENIRKWNGFIKFLKEYTMINTRNAEEIYIWEEYLVYAVAFGVATETINNMNNSYGFDSYVDKA